MKDNYISKIDTFKCSVIFQYIQDLERIFDLYKDTYYKDPSIKEFAIYQMSRLFNYLKGYMCGLDVKHKSYICFKDNIRYECISFYNNSSHTVKYMIFANFDMDTFRFSYIRKNKKNVSKFTCFNQRS